MTSIPATDRPGRTKNRRTGNVAVRQQTSRGDCKCGRRDSDHSRRGNWHPVHGIRCNRLAVAMCGDRTSSWLHGFPARRLAPDVPAQGYAVAQTWRSAAVLVVVAGSAALALVAVDSPSCLEGAIVGVVDLAESWLAAVVLQNYPVADAADSAALWPVAAGWRSCLAAEAVVAVAGPVDSAALWPVAAGWRSCLAAEAAVAVAGPVVPLLVAVVAGAADSAALGLAAVVAFRQVCPVVAVCPDPSNYPFGPAAR